MKMAKLTDFDSGWINETLNPSFSQWVEVKDDKTKATKEVKKKKVTKKHSYLIICAQQL